MPRSNDPEHYPDFFVEYVTGCALAGKTYRVPATGALPDDERTTGMEKALKIRGLFYAFIGSLKRARKREEEKGLAESKWTEIATYASKTMLSIDTDACAIYFLPRTKSWQNQILGTGAEVGVEEPTSSAAQESLKRLQEQLKGDFE